MAKRAPPAGTTLFEAAMKKDASLGGTVPLAERVRPRSLADMVGQEHLLGEGKLLARAIAADRVPSMILWGPPGSGKTTLARVHRRDDERALRPVQRRARRRARAAR